MLCTIGATCNGLRSKVDPAVHLCMLHPGLLLMRCLSLADL